MCFQVSAIESLLVAEGVSQVIGWINDEVDATTTQEDIDAKVCGPDVTAHFLDSTRRHVLVIYPASLCFRP